MTVDESNLLGLPAADCSKLLTALVPAHDRQLALEADSQLDLCARLIWSQLAEPGDELAGLLLSELGASTALRALRGDGGVAGSELRLWSLLQQNDSTLAAEGSELTTRSALRSGVERWVQRDNNAKLVRDLRTWQRLGGWIATLSSTYWPQQLLDLGNAAPICIWGRGNIESLNGLEKAVSIVGSRNTTSYGAWITRELATELAADGYRIVSGGAYGIDAFAHQATVELAESDPERFQFPVTIAVMAGGGDRLYPVGNSSLLKQVIKHGCVISELPPGNAPTKWRFLQRNRLIAALGQTVVVVEMAYRSGALNTVHHALQIGRRVVAVPGSILSPTSQGCNQVIEEGKAEIATSFDALLQLARGGSVEPQHYTQLTPMQQRILDSVTNQLRTAATIGQQSGAGLDEANQALAELELLGFLVRQSGKWKRSEWARISESGAKKAV